MDYIKAFTIGTSGPVWFVHLAQNALVDESYYSYSFRGYSLILPIYFGLMSMLALYLGKTYEWSLQKRLFITSMISIAFVLLLNIFYSRHVYKPYSDFTTKKWLIYTTQHMLRHLVNFNLILYYLTMQYDTSFWWKIFIIGSSFFSFFLTYLKVLWVDANNISNYDYKTFAVTEPYIQGFDLLLHILVFHIYFKFELSTTLIIWSIFGSFIWLALASYYQTYKYQEYEWINPLIRVMITGLIKSIPIYHLIMKT